MDQLTLPFMTNTEPLTVKKLESLMLKEKQVDCPVKHHFGPGIYIREVTVPAGTLALGHKQKQAQLNIFLKGEVLVLKDGEAVTLKAPAIFVGPAGRKLGYVKKAMTWLNVYATEERDIEKLETMFLDKSDEFNVVSQESKKSKEEVYEAQQDYKNALDELGVTEGEARMQSEDESDQLPFPSAVEVQVGPSEIEGRGLFATTSFTPGDIVAPAKIGNYRTPAGRFVNHSNSPNSKAVVFKDMIFFIAIKDIKGQAGGLLGDEILVDYRQTVNLVRSLICPE